MSLPTSPASERNKHVIAEAAAPYLERTESVLEVASGFGTHAEFFCGRFAHLRWTPTDPDPQAFAVLDARSRLVEGIASPLALDVCAPPAKLPSAGLVFCANMVHIAPWEASTGLFSVAAAVLRSEPTRTPGVMLTYGPYRFNGAFTSESNAEFDGWLKARDARFGVRDIESLDTAAEAVGARRTDVIDLPANNHLVVWQFLSDSKEP